MGNGNGCRERCSAADGRSSGRNRACADHPARLSTGRATCGDSIRRALRRRLAGKRYSQKPASGAVSVVAEYRRRFDTRVQACTALQQALRDTPSTWIDVGLAQINLGYQQHRYRQPCELLDPYRNLSIAAEILKEQHRPDEDWLLAIGRYHRPAGGEPAARYRRSVSRHLARIHKETSS